MPKKITGAKIACLDFSLQKAKMKMGVHVIVDDPEKLQGNVLKYSRDVFRKQRFSSQFFQCT